VLINGQEVLTGLSNLESLDTLHAVTTKHMVIVNNSEGIVIDFKALKGEPILNGIRVKRIY
jgi:hypothetical protein